MMCVAKVTSESVTDAGAKSNIPRANVAAGGGSAIGRD